MPSKRDRDVPVWIQAVVVGGAFLTFAVLERKYPLRLKERESKLTRDLRNLAVAGLAAAAVQLAERPVTNRLTLLTRRRHVGLLPWMRLPGWLDTLAGCLLLDLTLYHWHYLTHKVPALWQFHRVHHADLDMDASTGIRFHAGELLISVLFRAAQVLLFGISRRALSLWNTLLLVEVMFHHSNIGLPESVERRLSKVIVTPPLHGIHHSLVPDEVNSNWSSGLTVWDWLHGTFRRTARQADDVLDLGVPELQEPGEVGFGRLMTMPFDGSLPPPPGAPTRSGQRGGA